MQSQKSLGLAALLTALHFAAKLIGGYLTNSLALVSDAWHLLTDLLSLILSWWAMKKAVEPPNDRATYGLPRASILAALINNISLIAISFYIFYEAILRLRQPEVIESFGMSVLAGIGIIISAAIVYIVNDGAKTSLNVRSVWLHFAGEALASLGVFAGGILIYFTGWYWVDTLLSGALGLTILSGAITMLREITVILLEATPATVSVPEIACCLTRIPNVKAARDIHVWCLDEQQIALSAHIQVAKDMPVSQTEPLLAEIRCRLAEEFNITHINIQFELRPCIDCYHA